MLVGQDFPATISAWLALQSRGATVRFLPAPGGSPDPARLRAALAEHTQWVELAPTGWVATGIRRRSAAEHSFEVSSRAVGELDTIAPGTLGAIQPGVCGAQ